MSAASEPVKTVSWHDGCPNVAKSGQLVGEIEDRAPMLRAVPQYLHTKRDYEKPWLKGMSQKRPPQTTSGSPRVTPQRKGPTHSVGTSALKDEDNEIFAQPKVPTPIPPKAACSSSAYALQRLSGPNEAVVACRQCPKQQASLSNKPAFSPRRNFIPLVSPRVAKTLESPCLVSTRLSAGSLEAKISSSPAINNVKRRPQGQVVSSNILPRRTDTNGDVPLDSDDERTAGTCAMAKNAPGAAQTTFSSTLIVATEKTSALSIARPSSAPEPCQTMCDPLSDTATFDQFSNTHNLRMAQKAQHNKKRAHVSRQPVVQGQTLNNTSFAKTPATAVRPSTAGDRGQNVFDRLTDTSSFPARLRPLQHYGPLKQAAPFPLAPVSAAGPTRAGVSASMVGGPHVQPTAVSNGARARVKTREVHCSSDNEAALRVDGTVTTHIGRLWAKATSGSAFAMLSQIRDPVGPPLIRPTKVFRSASFFDDEEGAELWV